MQTLPVTDRRRHGDRPRPIQISGEDHPLLSTFLTTWTTLLDHRGVHFPLPVRAASTVAISWMRMTASESASPSDSGQTLSTSDDQTATWRSLGVPDLPRRARGVVEDDVSLVRIRLESRTRSEREITSHHLGSLCNQRILPSFADLCTEWRARWSSWSCVRGG